MNKLANYLSKYLSVSKYAYACIIREIYIFIYVWNKPDTERQLLYDLLVESNTVKQKLEQRVEW